MLMDIFVILFLVILAVYFLIYISKFLTQRELDLMSERAREEERKSKFYKQKHFFPKKRKASRVDIEKCYISIKKMGFFSRFRKYSSGELIDLSMTGISCVVFDKFRIDDEVEVYMQVPAFNNDLFVSGVISWTKEENYVQKIGIELDELSDHNRTHFLALKKYDILRSAKKD